MIVIVYANGACRGNPGPMGIGASIQDDRGKELATVSQLLGRGRITWQSTGQESKD